MPNFSRFSIGDRKALHDLAFEANVFFKRRAQKGYKTTRESVAHYHAIVGKAGKLEHMIHTSREIKENFCPEEENFYYHYVSILLLRILYLKGLKDLYETVDENSLFFEIVRYFSEYESIESNCQVTPTAEKVSSIALVENSLENLHRARDRASFEGDANVSISYDADQENERHGYSR